MYTSTRLHTRLPGRPTCAVMFELRTVDKVCHTFLSVIPPIQTNGTECSQTDGRTNGRTKVKTVCPPVSLRSLGGHNEM